MSIGQQKTGWLELPVILLAALTMCGCGGSGEANLDAGLASLRAGNYDAAAKSLESAADKIPDNASARCNLGIAYWKLGRHKDAMSCFRKAAQLSPDDVRPLEFLANVYIDMQNWNEARGVLIQADKRMPASPRILTTLAMVEFHSLNNPQALARLTQALDIDPAYAPALYDMALLHRDRLNNKEAASNYFKNYLKVAGDDARIKDLSDFLNKVSTSKPPVAAQIPPPVQPVAPKVGKQPVGDPLVASAKKAMEKQEFDSALEMLKQASRKNQPDPAALWELAALYDKYLKYDDKAAETYRKFAKHFPGDSRSTAALKRANELQAETKPAQKSESKPVPVAAAPQKDPDAAQKAFEEGLKAQNDQKWDEAISNYKHAIELDKSMSVAAYNMGLTYKSKGELDPAKDAFTQALYIDSNMSKAHYMLAVVLNLQKQNTQAVEQLNKIFRADPDYAKAHLLMGVILRDENDIEGAKSHFERYIKLAPEDPSAKTAQEWLNSVKNQ